LGQIGNGTPYEQDFSSSGQAVGPAYASATRLAPAYSHITLSGLDFLVHDNQAQLAGHGSVALPNEASGAVRQVAATALTSSGTAAVAWTDAGAGYASLFNAASNSFGPAITLDGGGESGVHVVALPDGGFAVSWMKGGAYRGELFDGSGAGGGVIALAGDVAGIDSHGNLLTVGQTSGGQYQIQTYAIHGSASDGGGGSGGSTGGGSATGQTFTSDNNGDHWTGTAGNDTFNLGRGGDVVTGNGGNDTYKFAEAPWAGGHITDFNAGDVLDLTGLMHTTSDTGSDGFADGYLKITADSAGNTQVWANYNLPGNNGWWLVETLDGVAPSSLTHSANVVTVGASSGGGGPPGQTFTSDNAGDHWVGTAGNDTFNLGRGGDVVTGNGGNDTFKFAEAPWAGGHITDFNSGDVLDVTGLLATTGYHGSDAMAAGYLKVTADSAGNAQVWADYQLPDNNGWWLVTTLDGVSTSSLHYGNGMFT
jgi:hypothetical protein